MSGQSTSGGFGGVVGAGFAGMGSAAKGADMEHLAR